MSETELKPCPFCGGAPHLKPSIRGDYTSIVCPIESVCCGPIVVVIPNDQIEEGIAAWNRRAPTLAAPVLPPAPARVGESANGVTQDDLMRMAREASIADGLELPHEIEAIMNFARAIESAIAAQAGGTVPIEEEICAEAYEAMLAAAPIAPVRQPLTDAQIIAGAKADWVDEFKDFQCGVKFAEHYYGIK